MKAPPPRPPQTRPPPTSARASSIWRALAGLCRSCRRAGHRRGRQRSIAQVRRPAAAYQTLLVADALRYLTLQICGAKGSGHPGGFASSAEAYAALVMLGHTNIVTEVGHHAPGFYSAMFLDRSLEEMGIRTVHGPARRASARSTACSAICPAPFPACSPPPARSARASISPWPAPCCIPARCSR